MPLPTQTFNNVAEWENWVNTNIVSNGMGDITGNFGNITENAAVKFIKQSPLNWQKVKIESAGGDIVASRPIVLFMTTTPDSLSWDDNIYNEYRFINTTENNIPLADGYEYYDIDLNPVSFISAKAIVTIVKASNDLWVLQHAEVTKITQTEGLLIIGRTYELTDYNGGDDFSNVADVQTGIINTDGCTFIAIGTTPTDWSNSSLVTLL